MNNTSTEEKIPLSPVFISLAGHFGVRPERLAEHVLTTFVKEKPRRIIRKAQWSEFCASHRR